MPPKTGAPVEVARDNIYIFALFSTWKIQNYPSRISDLWLQLNLPWYSFPGSRLASSQKEAY